MKTFQTRTLHETLVTSSEIIKRNINNVTIQTLELVDSVDPDFTLISPLFDEILHHMPQTKVRRIQVDLQLKPLLLLKIKISRKVSFY